jgi:SCF-associated factor 1
MSLYRRLKKETAIYLWGQHQRTRSVVPDHQQHRNIFRYPAEAWERRPGVIVDMQIGGWSTTVLDSAGRLFLSGKLNGMRGLEIGFLNFSELQFLTNGESGNESESVGRASPSLRVEGSKAIQSFSAGRTHVMGLADDGTCWLWFSTEKASVRLKFPDVGGDNAIVDWVCAGFSHCSVYIRHWGIVIINYENKHQEVNAIIDGIWEIPSSSDWTTLIPESSGSRNKITKHILLEKYVIWTTAQGTLFCSHLDAPQAFEIPEFSNVIDVQGAFRHFAIFKKDGGIEVLHQGFLLMCELRATDPMAPETEGSTELFKSIPALQNTGVVQLAFGDYHFLALHSDGRITSYGAESQSTGALGLCGIKSRVGSKIRGVRNTLANGVLLPHGYFTGRNVWFNSAKHRWLNTITSAYFSNPFVDEGHLGEFSEWVEQRGSDWDDIPEAAEKNSDGLGSHFALSVAAGGWSSGALVLVNEEMDEAISTHCPPPQLEKLPNIRFKDGSWSAPGEQKYNWKKEPPRFTITKDPGNQIWGIVGWRWDDEAGAEAVDDEVVDLGVD